MYSILPPLPKPHKKQQKPQRAEIYIVQELYQILNTECAWEVLERAVNWLAPECVNPEQSGVTASLAH